MSHSDNLPCGVILNLGSDEGAILIRLNSTDGNALQVFITFVNRLSLDTKFVWTTFRPNSDTQDIDITHIARRVDGHDQTPFEGRGDEPPTRYHPAEIIIPAAEDEDPVPTYTPQSTPVAAAETAAMPAPVIPGPARSTPYHSPVSTSSEGRSMDCSSQENPPAEDGNSTTANPQVEEGANSEDQYWNYED